jgi:hypothetical protein
MLNLSVTPLMAAALCALRRSELSGEAEQQALGRHQWPTSGGSRRSIAVMVPLTGDGARPSTAKGTTYVVIRNFSKSGVESNLQKRLDMYSIWRNSQFLLIRGDAPIESPSHRPCPVGRSVGRNR